MPLVSHTMSIDTLLFHQLNPKMNIIAAHLHTQRASERWAVRTCSCAARTITHQWNTFLLFRALAHTIYYRQLQYFSFALQASALRCAARTLCFWWFFFEIHKFMFRVIEVFLSVIRNSLSPFAAALHEHDNAYRLFLFRGRNMSSHRKCSRN